MTPLESNLIWILTGLLINVLFIMLFLMINPKKNNSVHKTVKITRNNH